MEKPVSPAENSIMDSPVGPLQLIAAGETLTGILFLDSGAGAEPTCASPLLADARRQLAAYFRGELQRFDLPLAPAGTAFQKSVWRALAEIPWGETRSYGELARAIGRPTAARAVGAANGANPLPIVLPCHRVIGASGTLTGYAGGLERKRRLLALEGLAAD